MIESLHCTVKSDTLKVNCENEERLMLVSPVSPVRITKWQQQIRIRVTNWLKYHEEIEPSMQRVLQQNRERRGSVTIWAVVITRTFRAAAAQKTKVSLLSQSVIAFT